MTGAIVCLDSGTTTVKAACFSSAGALLATDQAPNAALRRHGDRVEQDMEQTKEDGLTVLRRCMERAGPVMPAALIVTGQGDGLWPLDRHGKPCGPAITWLDGRTRALRSELAVSGVLGAIAEILMTEPTTASQPLQLLWLQRHEPYRVDTLATALRCKDWLFHVLTGALLCEPTGTVPSWGNPARQELSLDVERLLGLRRGICLLPPMVGTRASARPLSRSAAAATGLPAGLPVLLGPSDVQATAIGLGLGVQPDLRRASVIGTSAIHVSLIDAPTSRPAGPPGAIVQPFVEPGLALHLFPGFNGGVAFGHVGRLFGSADGSAGSAYSTVLVHPFFESGGERAPITAGTAGVSLFGLDAGTTGAEIAWAAREAVAFLARMSHAAMGGLGNGCIALGGGLAADRVFVHFLTHALGCTVRIPVDRHAGLGGAALVAAAVLAGCGLQDQAAEWPPLQAETIEPSDEWLTRYAEAKFSLFERSLAAAAPIWDGLAALKTVIKRTGPFV